MGQENLKLKRKHVTIAMFSDVDPKVDGIQFVMPMVPCGMLVELKHKKMIILAANTCQSFSAINGINHGDCPNGDYSDELEYGIQYLSQGGDQSDFERQFFQQMQAVANSNISQHVFPNNVLDTLEKLYPGRIKGAAFAFSGYQDDDHYGIITDNNNRNPVDKLYTDCGQSGARRYNSVGLSALFSRDELDLFDDRIAEWLDNDGKNFFRTEETLNGKERRVYPKYSFVYLLQSLVQAILVDYEGKLSRLDEQKILDNWHSFLNDLYDKKNEKTLFEKYKGDTDVNCPINFIEFCLNKFLAKTDVLEEINKDINNYKCYADASTALSNNLKSALHANQVVAIIIDDKNLTRGDYCILANNFLYSPLCTTYEDMNEDLKSTLESLGGQLKYKQAKLDQTKIKALNADEIENQFGYHIYKTQEEVKNEKGKVVGKKTVSKVAVPTCYNPCISREKFKERMRAIEEYNKITDNEFLGLGLEEISKYINDGFYISAARARRLISNDDFMQQLYKKLTQGNVDEKYKITYRVIFVKFCQLSEGELYDAALNGAHLENYLVVNFLPESIIKLMFSTDKLQTKILCELDTQEIYKNQLMESVKSDVICGMLQNKNQSKKANEILKLCLGQLKDNTLRSLDFSNDGGLDSSVRNIIIFSRIKNLSNNQVQQIDLSQLDEKCVDLLLSDDYLSKLTKQQLTYLFSNRKDLFEKLTPKRMFGLISNEDFISALDAFNNKGDVFSLINFEKIINFAGDPTKRESVVSFIAKYINELPCDKVISLLPSLFVQKANETSNSEKDKSTIRNKMNKVQEENILYQNIFKLRNCDFRDEPWEKLNEVLAKINDPNEQKELIRYLFMNYESYFIHLNALLEKIAPENADSQEISNAKKLVVDILKSSTEKDKLDGVKIINKVVGKISFEDVSGLSSMLNSIVKTFIDDLDIPSLKKVVFSELQPDVLKELLNRRFDDIPAEPYSDLILDFNSVGQEIAKFDLNKNTLEQKRDRLFHNIVIVNNFFIDYGIKERLRISDLQNKHPLWELLSVELVDAVADVTELEGKKENGMQYTDEEKLATMTPSLSSMSKSLQECISKLDKKSQIYNCLTDIQKTLEQWNKINNSIGSISKVIGRFSCISHVIGGIKKRVTQYNKEKNDKKNDQDNKNKESKETPRLRNGEKVDLMGYVNTFKTMLDGSNAEQKLKTIEEKITDLNTKLQGTQSMLEKAKIRQEKQRLNGQKLVIEDAMSLKQAFQADKELKESIEPLQKQLDQCAIMLSNIKDVNLVKDEKLTEFLAYFDKLEKIKGELETKAATSKKALLDLYFGDFKNKFANYNKVFKEIKSKNCLLDVLESVEPELVQMFKEEKKPINYDVLRLDAALYYSKAKSYFFNQIGRLGLDMSVIRNYLLSILSSTDKSNKEAIDKYNEIVKRFVQFNIDPSNTEDMMNLGKTYFDFTDEDGKPGSNLSAKQIGELGIINMLEGGKEYTPDFMLKKNLCTLIEYGSKIHGNDDTKYNVLKELGIGNLAFKSVKEDEDESKVLLESYFDYKNLFDDFSFAQLVFNTFRDIKGDQLNNLDLQFGKGNLQMNMDNGAIEQNFYLLLKKVYDKTKGKDGESIAQALSGLSASDMKTLAFFLGDWIAGNSDFYRANGFGAVCDIIKDRIEFGCREKTINGEVWHKLDFTEEQIGALIAHAFLTPKKFSDRVDEICRIRPEDMYKVIRMLLEKGNDKKFTLDDISNIQSYSVKTDYTYQRIKDDVYSGTAIDHDRGPNVILDCFSQPLSDLMKYLLDNMDSKPSLMELLNKIRNNTSNGMWWQSIPGDFMKSELKSAFKGNNAKARVRALDAKGNDGFITLLKRYQKYNENMKFSTADILDMVDAFVAFYNKQLRECSNGYIEFLFDLISLISSDNNTDLYKAVLNKLSEGCACFDSGDIRHIIEFCKKCSGGTNTLFLGCQQVARLLFRGNYFVYCQISSTPDYKQWTGISKNESSISYLFRLDDLIKEFDSCRCMASSGVLPLIDYIKMINWFCYRDMFHILFITSSSTTINKYNPVPIEENCLLNYNCLNSLLSEAEYSDTNWNNILDNLYKSDFELSQDFSDSLGQLLKSSIQNSKASDAFKELPSRLCDVYSVFKISLRKCDSHENIKNMFDRMRKSEPLKVAIDNKQISFSESKILTMKLLAALRLRANSNKVDNKEKLTSKSFMTILQYLNENTEDQSYFDVQNKSLQEENFKKDFDLVVRYVMDNFCGLFPDTTSESRSSDFDNVVSFLRRFGVMVPKEYMDKEINLLTDKFNGNVKDQNANKDTTKKISDVETTNVPLFGIHEEEEAKETPAHVETESTQGRTDNYNDKTTDNTGIGGTTNNQIDETKISDTNPQSTDVQNTTVKTNQLTEFKNQISKADANVYDNDNHEQANDTRNNGKTNEASNIGIGYTIPVILTVISLALWAISIYSGFSLFWIASSSIVTVGTSVSWIIKIFISSTEDKLLPLDSEGINNNNEHLNFTDNNISHGHKDKYDNVNVPNQSTETINENNQRSH